MPTPTQVRVTSCPSTISSPGNYTLAANLAASGTCITINAGGARSTLDCGGKNITGRGSGYGILLNGTANVTVANCAVSNFADGIYLRGSTGNKLQNLNASNNTIGILLNVSDQNLLMNSRAERNSQYGIYLYDSSDSNNLTSNTANSNGQHGIYILVSSGNRLSGNSVCLNRPVDINCSQAQIDAGRNICSPKGNSTCGAVCNAGCPPFPGWFFGEIMNITRPVGNATVTARNSTGSWSNTTNASGQFILRNLLLGKYNITVGRAGYFNSTGQANVTTDAGTELNFTLRPLVMPLSCGDVMNETGNYTLSGNLATNGTCITITSLAKGSTLDCGGKRMTGDGSGYGIYLNNASSVTVKNCAITGFEQGIYLQSSRNNTLLNNNATSNSLSGIYADSSQNNTLTGNRACGNLDLDMNCTSTQINGGGNICKPIGVNAQCGIACNAGCT